MPPFTNEEDVKAFLTTVIDSIKQNGNPEVLNQYRSVFRKQVPFFMRSYIAAYLIQQAVEGKRKGRRSYTKNRGPLLKNHSPLRTESFTEDEQKKQNLPEEESARIFISVGRNRHVFPREILSLILSEIDIKKEDIGLIRILDNYSFVQVRKEWADAIITALNGKIFKGRSITVNHARTRNEENSSSEKSITAFNSIDKTLMDKTGSEE
ncbi:DbpA RNA binding domain-containing protein [Gracilinema caldarium]|uniref:DbpA RNA-binding domain protein n=1 Tax=Gracilinema caldarium (strain ATCC 51460 / DSM 7334 / H1) TaxID=744872 RepID=F8F054_GRAC1|nr:DbpA RNA binding domain-containing protein [Gracilinema caldarium]AEJ18707.1 DbpA RNA-binding domain protein [Gracilinema caldarium DSM 7334]